MNIYDEHYYTAAGAQDPWVAWKLTSLRIGISITQGPGTIWERLCADSLACPWLESVLLRRRG